MNTRDFHKHVAQIAYNIGFGAKIHFATYDIVDKAPGTIGLLSMGVGVFALVVPLLSTHEVSAALIVAGILALYLSFYDRDKERYNEAGKQLTRLYDQLTQINVQCLDTTDEVEQKVIEQVHAIQASSHEFGISKQVMFSDWLAHYKFFWQHQSKWVVNALELTLVRDKIPLTFTLVLVALFVGLVGYFLPNLLKNGMDLLAKCT